MQVRIRTTVDELRLPTACTEGDWRARFAEFLKKHGIDPMPQDGAVVARINYARWVGSCTCGSSMALHPDWQFAGCLLCGRSWSAVTFPDPETVEAIDAILAQRPTRPAGHILPYPWYSWRPDKTLEQLAEENVRIAAGLRV